MRSSGRNYWGGSCEELPVVFQASKEHTVDIMEKYRAVHPHIKFDTLDERIAMFKSLNWLVPTTSDDSAYKVEGGGVQEPEE